MSYLYYLLYELFSPQIEIFGLVTMILAGLVGMLNVQFMIGFLILYAVYGSVLTMTAFFQRIYTQNLKIYARDAIWACFICVLENIFFRFVLDFVRVFSFAGYKKKQWGTLNRQKHNQ